LQFTNERNYVLEKNGGEMEAGEDRSKWQEALDAVEHDGADEVSTREEAMQAENGKGGDIEEGGESQPNALDSVPGLQRESESGPEGEVNDIRNEDTTVLEPWPATKTTSRTVTTAPSRPIRSKKVKKVDASGPSSRAACGN
jgi:hypothetical protein